MAETLNIETTSLTGIGNSLTEVGSMVRDTYTNLTKTINAVTANDSWKGEASETFLNKFENLRPEFEKDLDSLEKLGPAIKQIAGNYADQEAENTSQIGGTQNGW